MTDDEVVIHVVAGKAVLNVITLQGVQLITVKEGDVLRVTSTVNTTHNMMCQKDIGVANG